MPYSPKINPQLVRRLYVFKHSQLQKIPMTKLVNEAVEEYLNKRSNDETEHRFSEAGNKNNLCDTQSPKERTVG